MTMDQLAESLLSESKAEADKIISFAKGESKKLIAEMEKSEKDRLETAEKEVKTRLDSQKREKIAWANLEKKKILSEAKEDAVNIALEEVRTNLSKLRRHSSYPAFLKEKTQRAIQDIGVSSITIHVVKGDKTHLKSIKAKIVEDLKASGGVLVENKSKDIFVKYTLETLLEVKKPELRKRIYLSLFGG